MECPIRYDVIEENDKTILKCSHTFHYDCIMKEYKNQLQNRNTKLRICPYCRGYGGYLKMKSQCVPVKHLTEHYNIFYDHLKNNEYDEIKDYFDNSRCFFILKTGKNKGNQCSRKKKHNYLFCGIHAKSI